MRKTKPEPSGPELKPVSAAAALKQKRDDLIVKESKEIEIGPEGDYARYFQRVRLTSFKDLQSMSMIPQGLDEKKVIDAIARDNDAAFEAAQRAPADGARGCGCEGSETEAASGNSKPGATLRARYSGLRRSFHPHLAKLLTEVYRREVSWDHILATQVYRLVDRLTVAKAVDLGSILMKDIVVQKNSTLNVAASSQLLWANNIRIHTGGKIVTPGSYLKIQCVSIQGNLP